MGRSPSYRSPSSKLRSQRRLSKFLKTKLSSLPTHQPTLSFTKSSMDIPPLAPNLVKTPTGFTNYPPPAEPKLSISNAVLTNYPSGCLVCQQFQCEYDHRHGAYFAFKIALEEQLQNIWPKKPPDDASGLLVATQKESEEASF